MGMVKSGKSIIAALFVSVLVVLGLTMGISAQESSPSQVGNGFRISPLRNEEVIEKGQTKEVILEVTNPTASNINAKVIINDFEANNVNGEPKIFYDPDTSAPGNSFKSITTTPASVSIAAGQSVKVPVTITIKDTNSSGGYYGAVRFEPEALPGDANVSIGASVGSLFLVTVPGDITESLEIVQLTAAKGTTPENTSNGSFFIGNGSDMKVVTSLKNTGSIHVKPFGRIQVADSKGNIVEQYEFNNTDPRSNVLPNSTRTFTDNLNYNKFFGKYTITANLGYGSAGNLITAKSSFWVIPVWLVVVAVATLILIVVGAFLLYRKLRQNRKHKVAPRRR